MKKNLIPFVLLLLTLGFAACDEEHNETELENRPETSYSSEAQGQRPMKAPLEAPAIKENSFMGIAVGTPISGINVRNYKKTTRTTGEGPVHTYEIIGTDGYKVGYFLPDTEDEMMVGDIIITSKEYRTENGVVVGTTYEELHEMFPQLQLHNAEIEKRAQVKYGNFVYGLDYPKPDEEEIALKDIPKTAKVTQIRILKD